MALDETLYYLVGKEQACGEFKLYVYVHQSKADGIPKQARHLYRKHRYFEEYFELADTVEYNAKDYEKNGYMIAPPEIYLAQGWCYTLKTIPPKTDALLKFKQFA